MKTKTTLLCFVVLVAIFLFVIFIANKRTPTLSPFSFTMATSTSGYAYPVISGYPDQITQSKVNQQLKYNAEDWGCFSGFNEDELRGRLSDFSTFDDTSYYKDLNDDQIYKMSKPELLAELAKTTSFDVKENVEYSKKDIFSLSVKINSDCKSLIPSVYFDNSTFDMKTGELISFKELFKDYDINKEKILKDIFKVQMVSSPEGLEGCEKAYSIDNLAGSDFDYFISNDGLNVSPGWPHAAEACVQSVLVPTSEIPKIFPSDFLKRIVE